MNWKSPPREHAVDGPGLSEHVTGLLSSVLGYLQARCELAGIEGREAVSIYGKAVAFLVAAAGLLVFGYIFLWIGIMALTAWLLGVYWGWVVLGAGILHIIAAVGFAIAAKVKWGKPVFPVTLQELRKDQEWLTRPTQTASRS